MPRELTVVQAVTDALRTEMAQWLLLQRNTTGHFQTAAKLRPTWKSPSLVLPSPNDAITTLRSPRYLAA